MKKIKKISSMILYYYPNKWKNYISHMYYKVRIRGDIDTLKLHGDCNINFPEKLVVGHNCIINENVKMFTNGGIELADHVCISYGATLLTKAYDTKDWIVECENCRPDKHHVEKSIYSGNHTWVGANAVILGGVRITGIGVIIAAGSVVTHDISEDYVMVAGIPAKVVKHLQ